NYALTFFRAEDKFRVKRNKRWSGVGRINRDTALSTEDRMLAVAAHGGVRVANISSSAVARPTGAVVPTARVLRDVAADCALVANLRRGYKVCGLGENIIFLLNDRMTRDLDQRSHCADLKAITRLANSFEFFDSTEVDDSFRLLDPVLQPIEAVEPACQHPAVTPMLCECALSFGHRSWLEQFEARHHISNYSHSSLRYSLYMGGQWILHGPPSLERGKNRVCIHRGAAENIVADSIGQRVQNRSATATHWRLANSASSNRRFRIRNVERRPLHVDGNIEDARRLGLIEAARNHVAVFGIEDPFLPDGVANAERRASEHLAAERARVDHSANIGIRKKINDVILAGITINFHFGKRRNEGH